MITNRQLLKTIFSQKSFVCVEIIFFSSKNVKFGPPKREREKMLVIALPSSIHHGMLVDVKSELNTLLGFQLFQKLKEPAVLMKEPARNHHGLFLGNSFHYLIFEETMLISRVR